MTIQSWEGSSSFLVSVLLECSNVIVRRSAVERSYPGGLGQFGRDVPDASYCADQHLVRVGFMASWDAEAFVEKLVERGFRFSTDDDSDICVADGPWPTSPCRWLHFEPDNAAQGRCWWAGDEPGELAVPQAHPREHGHGQPEDHAAHGPRAREFGADRTKRAECPSCGRLFATRAGGACQVE